MKEYNIFFMVCVYPMDLIIAMKTDRGRHQYQMFEPEYGMDEASNVKENELLISIPKSELPESITENFDFKRRETLSRIESVYVYKSEVIAMNN